MRSAPAANQTYHYDSCKPTPDTHELSSDRLLASTPRLTSSSTPAAPPTLSSRSSRFTATLGTMLKGKDRSDSVGSSNRLSPPNQENAVFTSSSTSTPPVPAVSSFYSSSNSSRVRNGSTSSFTGPSSPPSSTMSARRGSTCGSTSRDQQAPSATASKPPVSINRIFRRRQSSSASTTDPATNNSVESLSASAPASSNSRFRSGSIGAAWASRSSLFLHRNSSGTGTAVSSPPSSISPGRVRAFSEDSPRSSELGGEGLPTYFPPQAMPPKRPSANSASSGSGSGSGSAAGGERTRNSATSSSAAAPQSQASAPGALGSGYGFSSAGLNGAHREQDEEEDDEDARRRGALPDGRRRLSASSPELPVEETELGATTSPNAAEEVELGDFARGDDAPAYTATPSPFPSRQSNGSTRSPRLSTSPTFRPPFLASSPSSAPRPISPVGLHERRHVESLHLSSFGRPALPLDTSSGRGQGAQRPLESDEEDENGEMSSTPSPEAFDPAPTSRRLASLPRLMSNNGYSLPTMASLNRSAAASPPTDDEAEMETGAETGTETETEMDTDDEEGRSGDVFPPSALPSTFAPPPSRTLSRNPSASGASPFVPSSWVLFDPLTPTPGPLRTARPVTESNGGSYFDLPTRTPSSSATVARTPGGGAGPLMSPLLPMSASSVARGKRPTRADEANLTPATAGAPSDSLLAPPASESSSTSGEGGLNGYRRRSHSAVALLSPRLDVDHERDAIGASDPAPVGVGGLDEVWHSGPAGQSTPGPSFLRFPSFRQAQSPVASPSFNKSLSPPSPASAIPATSPGPRSSSISNRLHRPRSMYELHISPPAYHSVYQRPGQTHQIVFPREEEGREGLPGYTCGIHLEAYLPRKMEFTAPNVQAKDRAWKRQFFVLHGTAIKIYKFDLKTHPIPGEEDWSGLSEEEVGSAMTNGTRPLHFHVGEYGGGEAVTGSGSEPKKKFSASLVEAKSKAKQQLATNGGQNVLLRHYSLSNAESGLAADYLKRKHAVRVRAEGEQFLLQAKDDRGVIDLIEALQAATNVALDLDERPLPKFITLPRRRRRRRRPEATTADGAAAPASEGAGGRASQSGIGDMLAEEQHAYAGEAEQGTVM